MNYKFETVDLKNPYMFFLSNEIKILIDNYVWTWNEKDYCYYNEFGEDITDTVYYDDNDYFYCHPKVLASYVTEYLNNKR